MNMTGANRTSLILSAALLVVAALAAFRPESASAQREGSSGASPHYSVIATEGHNLIVTDNHTNELYFYTIDQDKEVGSELKLRGRVDLAQVGKPMIKPVTHKSQP